MPANRHSTLGALRGRIRASRTRSRHRAHILHRASVSPLDGLRHVASSQIPRPFAYGASARRCGLARSPGIRSLILGAMVFGRQLLVLLADRCRSTHWLICAFAGWRRHACRYGGRPGHRPSPSTVTEIPHLEYINPWIVDTAPSLANRWLPDPLHKGVETEASCGFGRLCRSKRRIAWRRAEARSRPEAENETGRVGAAVLRAIIVCVRELLSGGTNAFPTRICQSVATVDLSGSGTATNP